MVRASGRFTVLLAILTLSLGALGASGAEASTPPRATPVVGAHASNLTQTVCKIVENQSVGSAAAKLLSDGGGVVGELLGQLVVTAVQSNCSWLVTEAVKVVQSMLATVHPPPTPALSPVGSYLSRLASERVSQMATQLGMSASSVLAARAEVCAAVSGGQSPADVIARDFRAAHVSNLAALDAFVRLAVETCRGIDGAAANFISGAALAVALAHERRPDHDPPVVEITQSTARRAAGGPTSLAVQFRAFDPGGLRSCEVLLWYAGLWHGQPTGGSCAPYGVGLTPGTRYAWAYRATDVAGNVSQWVTTGFGTS
jgi:hypothetical protein